MSTRKKFWWISVGGNPCEPATVAEEGIFTAGCPDPHDPDTVELVQEMTVIPLTQKQEKREQKNWEAKMRRDAALGIHHGYRRF